MKAKLRDIDAPSPFRIGRFVIKREAVSAREVAFNTEATIRFTIKLAGED